MNKKIKWSLIIIVSLAVLLVAGGKFMQYNTKKASPEGTAVYKKNGKDISVFYCRPYKKERVIFGGLVPYDSVWRTGANEASTFTTATELIIGDKKLPIGEYTLWTIPGKTEWTVMINSGHYGWGVNFNQQASREPEKDVLQVKVPVETLETPVEQFTIAFEDTDSLKMVLTWDNTRVAVPIQ